MCNSIFDSRKHLKICTTEEYTMSLEPGGRADKYGNKYENCYLAKLLLRLVKEKLTSVTVEPLGINSDSVEFISEQKDGIINYYQCKASNTTHSSWSISDLRKYKVFERSKRIIYDNTKNRYYFISPRPSELNELCKRARTNSSSEDFKNFQLTNNTIRRMFNDCIVEFGFDKNNPSATAETVSLLSHCFFEQYVTGTEAEQDLEGYISEIFTGNASVIRVLLEQYANDTGHYGIKITAKDIIDYLEKKDIHVRSYQRKKTILNRIHVLNNTYWDHYPAIHENLIHRTATDNIIQSIKSGFSVILHGKAGTGKSGCLEETISYLKQAGILYLAIKLDKHIPHKSADAYGQDLGLPESPVYCLATLAAENPCVLILDQLDALRWTSNHSGDALDVCKEFIQQAESINKYSQGKISIIFASRTFDLDNDRGLKELFAFSNSHAALQWHKVNVSQFTKNDVVQVIGQAYNHLSSRLQKLLLIPSSLYVWSKLEKNVKNNSVSSVFELMNIWWYQIQEKCIPAGLKTETVIACKNRIVASMENRTVFSLPQAIFADQMNEIDNLVSCGLLNRNPNTKSISFTHQSFLDYFITSDILNKIYSGHELKDLIGNKNQQTPFIRYHILTVLQNLFDSDPNLFVKQSIELLEAPFIRFYFKCTVFEIIGQCDSPTVEIYKIVDQYIQKPEWTDYITQVVLYGHPAFIMRLPSPLNSVSLSDEYLSLLKSISSKEPDFVLNKLRPFAFLNDEQDCKIFGTLCLNVNDDSDEMFKFRMQLLQNNPTLFQNFWGFPELIRRSSPRAIDLFEIIIKNWPIPKISHLYLGESKSLSDYIKQYAWPLVTRLFFKICEVTSNYLPHWPENRWNQNYEDWKLINIEDSIVRKITEIVKEAFTECAQSSPDKLIAFIKGVKYPISAVGHECIMHAVLSLPINYANDVVMWLLENIDQKIFVFSANENNFLEYSTQIIKKFSSACSIELFQQLERYICNWKESTERMVDIFKDRLKVRKEHHIPVYYAYWGHFQKALLPNMDTSRLSSYSKQLLNVVSRNSWIQLPYFYCGFTTGPVKTIASPVDNYIERLSDKTWLQIISTPQSKMNGRWYTPKNSPCYIEASHQTFASALGIQAKRDPFRFAKLSLLFPPNCYEGYILHILYALSNDNSNQDFDVELISKIIQRYRTSKNPDILMAILRMIEKHASEVWSEDIIKTIINIALSYPSSDECRCGITSNSDSKHQSVHSLLVDSANCVRGCAFHTIAALLWKHYDWGDKFKSTILSGSKDSNPAVRFATMNCILPYYNIEKVFAVKIFTSLTDADLRIICIHGYWAILSREYDNDPSYYRKKLIEACLSKDDDLAETSAELLCAIGIFYNDKEALTFIMSHQFNAKQENRICLQAVSSFNLDEYHEKSKMVLTHLLNHSSNELTGFNHLFIDQRIKIKRDEKFLIHLMKSPQGVPLSHPFLNYLYKSNENICDFAHILEIISNNLSPKFPHGKELIVTDLVKCVIRLFDKGKDDPIICEICLNIWDKLFMSSPYDIKPLSDMIDDFE